MTIFDSVISLIPLSSALLSFLISIASFVISNILSKRTEKNIKEVHIKINDKKIKLEGYKEKELVELLQRLECEKREKEKELVILLKKIEIEKEKMI